MTGKIQYSLMSKGIPLNALLINNYWNIVVKQLKMKKLKIRKIMIVIKIFISLA